MADKSVTDAKATSKMNMKRTGGTFRSDFADFGFGELCPRITISRKPARPRRGHRDWYPNTGTTRYSIRPSVGSVAVSAGVSPLTVPIRSVILRCPKKEMVGANTCSVVAFMQDAKRVGVLPVLGKEGYSANARKKAQPISATPCKLPVALFILSPGPYPAFTVWPMADRLINVLPESKNREFHERWKGLGCVYLAALWCAAFWRILGIGHCDLLNRLRAWPSGASTLAAFSMLPPFTEGAVCV